MKPKTEAWIKLYAKNHGWKKCDKETMVNEISNLNATISKQAERLNESIGEPELAAIHQNYADQMIELERELNLYRDARKRITQHPLLSRREP